MTTLSHFARVSQHLCHANMADQIGSSQIVFVGCPDTPSGPSEKKERIESAYKILRNGGSVVVFTDLLDLSDSTHLLEKAKFKQARYIQALSEDSSNASFHPAANRLMAVIAVKKGNSTFNTHYHSGCFPVPKDYGPDDRARHFLSEIVAIHSNPGDIISTADPGLEKHLMSLSVEPRAQKAPSDAELRKWKKTIS